MIKKINKSVKNEFMKQIRSAIGQMFSYLSASRPSATSVATPRAPYQPRVAVEYAGGRHQSRVSIVQNRFAHVLRL